MLEPPIHLRRCRSGKLDKVMEKGFRLVYGCKTDRGTGWNNNVSLCENVACAFTKTKIPDCWTGWNYNVSLCENVVLIRWSKTRVCTLLLRWLKTRVCTFVIEDEDSSDNKGSSLVSVVFLDRSDKSGTIDSRRLPSGLVLSFSTLGTSFVWIPNSKRDLHRITRFCVRKVDNLRMSRRRIVGW